MNTRTRTGHNIHEEYGRLKYGGAATVSSDLLAIQVLDIGAYDYRIGRWTWMRWETPEGKRNMILLAYAPAPRRKRKIHYISSNGNIYDGPRTNLETQNIPLG